MRAVRGSSCGSLNCPIRGVIAPFAACLVWLLASLATAGAASAAFSSAGTVSPPGRSASAPLVAVAANGDAVAAWLRFDGTSTRCCHRLQARFRSAARRSWSPVQNVSPPGRSAAEPAVAVDAQGDAVFAWVSPDATDACGGRGCDRLFTRSRSVRTGTLGAVQTLSTSGGHADVPRVAVDRDGDAVFVWKRRAASGCCDSLQTRARSAGGSLSPIQTLADGGSVPQVEVDRDSDAVFVWQHFEDAGSGCCWRVKLRARSARTGKLGAIQVLSPVGQNALGAGVALTPDGRAVVAWRTLDRFGGDVGVEVRTRSPAGMLGPIERISPPGQNLRLAPRVGVESDGDAVVSWVHLTARDTVLAGRRRSWGGGLGGVQIVAHTTATIEAHDLAVDGRGNAVFGWETGDPAAQCCRRLWARSVPADGSSSPAQNLALRGRGGLEAAVSIDPDGGLDPKRGDAFVVWKRPDGTACCERIKAAKQLACDGFASPFGSDARSGSRSAPFRTAERLAESLAPGETGCLRGGTYRENLTLRRGGALGQPLTLRSHPGERAKLLGRLWITEPADFITISSLSLDGSAAPRCDPGTSCAVLPSPTVNGDGVVFRGNDVTNRSTGICFTLGSHTYGRAIRTTIEGNRIHHCGRRPATNHDHGIYVEAADDTRIEQNVIHDNADRGIQLYPDAQRTYIAHNVIDGSGEGILFAARSAGNLAEHNLITNSRIRWNLESYNLVGSGNEARFNCLHATNPDPSFNQNGGVDPTIGAFVHDNVVADPGYVNRAGKDFRLREGSPCAGKGPG